MPVLCRWQVLEPSFLAVFLLNELSCLLCFCWKKYFLIIRSLLPKLEVSLTRLTCKNSGIGCRGLDDLHRWEFWEFVSTSCLHFEPATCNPRPMSFRRPFFSLEWWENVELVGKAVLLLVEKLIESYLSHHLTLNSKEKLMCNGLMDGEKVNKIKANPTSNP